MGCWRMMHVHLRAYVWGVWADILAQFRHLLNMFDHNSTSGSRFGGSKRGVLPGMIIAQVEPEMVKPKRQRESF